MSNPHTDLGRRERQIMDIVYRLGRATAEDVRRELSDPLTNSAVRGMLRHLESKGYLRHKREGQRFVYRPTADPEDVRSGAVAELVRTFFSNSASSAVIAMLGEYRHRLSDQDLDRMESAIEEMRKKGGGR
jgi:predicted transcriptional regulator